MSTHQAVDVQVAIPNPDDHLIHVTMRFEHTEAYSTFDVQMPVWSPGSYLVREYARHLQNIRAHDQSGRLLPVSQRDKASWRVTTDSNTTAVVLSYQMYGHELMVRTNHVDATHASINGVSTFLYHEDYLDHPVHLDFSKTPESWSVWGGMDTVDAKAKRYSVANFDLLYDTPVEIGDYDPITFHVDEIPHHVLMWGEGNWDAERLAVDMKKIVEAHAAMFGGLPYEHYTFIVHLTDRGRGGLEHHNSTILLGGRHDFRDGPPGSELDDEGYPQKGYLDFLRLVSHEHFHTWNVKRIRPERLGPFDYQRENYTRDLWTVEGVTSYYENIAMLRAGLMDGPRLLKIVADAAKLLDQIPGRKLHSLEDASFNAWVKLYRPDENTRNSSVSYYLKGELVCFLLDAKIRAESSNKHSLDDVLLALWSHYQETGEGYAEGSYGDWIKRSTGVDVSGFLRRFVSGTDEIDWNAELGAVGLSLEQKDTPDGASLGLALKNEGNRLVVTRVTHDEAAFHAGIYAGDELVALDGWRLSPAEVDKLLARQEPGTDAQVHLFRRGELLTKSITLDAPAAKTWHLHMREDATDAQRTLLSSWLSLSPDQDTTS